LPRPIRTRFITASNCVHSWTWPAVTGTARGRPPPSATRWSLLPNPPRERPSAWSAGSSAPRFSRPPRPSVTRAPSSRPRTINPSRCGPRRPADLQRLQDALEDLPSPPGVEVVIDRLPGPESLREIPPRGATAQHPEHAVQHRPRFFQPRAGHRLWNQRFDHCPLFIRELVTAHPFG